MMKAHQTKRKIVTNTQIYLKNELNSNEIFLCF